MNTTFFTTLTTQEFQELIELSVRNVVNLKSPRPDDEEDTLLDTKEAAELIKYEVTSVYGLVKRKKIPFCKVEGKLLFSRKKLLAWIGSGQQAVAQ
ncbi:helix-turn-helix domain-containing protein [Mucilaginibacter sp. SMC90]|uniref:helix-turn-helix domain-containing protein n=1 Tax=Mucilaginibacter sp. SMC90 TaxID=2929803 RepID=UPI001FB3A377|nr:helix-turn-helix domain-containing protein [Mucilaginibacter sp. SMC90]UOE49378.1 helix-turn-helix domain-containing protein [Mucilaginibacter sp. SMC90]